MLLYWKRIAAHSTKELLHGNLARWRAEQCAETLLPSGIAVRLEPKHPRIGALVYEAAERTREMKRKAEVSSQN